MTEEGKRICEELDAALFSADTFCDPSSVVELHEYIQRWNRWIHQHTTSYGLKQEIYGFTETIEGT